MPKVFAREKGIEIRVGNYGTVTFDRSVVVPQAVAEELASNERVRAEQENTAATITTSKKSVTETTAPEAEKE